MIFNLIALTGLGSRGELKAAGWIPRGEVQTDQDERASSKEFPGE